MLNTSMLGGASTEECEGAGDEGRVGWTTGRLEFAEMVVLLLEEVGEGGDNGA